MFVSFLDKFNKILMMQEAAQTFPPWGAEKRDSENHSYARDAWILPQTINRKWGHASVKVDDFHCQFWWFQSHSIKFLIYCHFFFPQKLFSHNFIFSNFQFQNNTQLFLAYLLCFNNQNNAECFLNACVQNSCPERTETVWGGWLV